MAQYAKPAYQVQEVNAAAKLVAQFLSMPEEEFEANRPKFSKAIEVIDNWRASHAFPLNTFNMTLKNRAQGIDGSSLTAQRIKRLESIALKLLHERDMKLSQMQDLGGCRAIMPTLKHVEQLRKLYKEKPVTHQFNGEKDYIAEPKETGYRGVHWKYRFTGKGTSEPWNNLKIEIQLRTALQHKWATAVEAAATFTRQALKSNRGPQEWLRFFALMSSFFALREGCPTIPGTPVKLNELGDELRELNAQHHIHNVFSQFRTIIPTIEKQSKNGYFLVILDPLKMEVKVEGFTKLQSQEANKAYTQAETILPKTTNVVLVSVSSINALKRAYPNYFLDTEDFLREVSAVVDFA
jgi:ppGpp synthetase/RelA/SpoT-type nucleotidyltranferase